MKEDRLEYALRTVSARRNYAETQNRERVEEVGSRIPEIAEINRQLFRTGRDLMQIIRSGQDISQKIEDLRQQNMQAQEMIRQLLVQHGYPQDYLEMHYTCEKCQDTGYYGGTFCTCVTDLAAKQAVKELNQSVQFESCSFSNFSLSYYQGQHTETGGNCYAAMERVLFFCREYASHFTLSSSSILMFGKTGLGKTHLSLAIANEVLQKGFSVLYDSVINFLRQVEKEHFGREEKGTDTLEMLLSCDLLILDDLGTEFRSQFYQSAVYNIVNTRMNRKKPTIISTNMDYDGISYQYDERITSRIFTTYTCLQFVGTDVRVLKKQQEQQRGKTDSMR